MPWRLGTLARPYRRYCHLVVAPNGSYYVA
jgi:hypothetical protein